MSKRQTDLEKSLMKLAKAAGEMQRAAKEVKNILGLHGIRRKEPRLVMCEKCEERMEEMSLEREGGERLYRCPKCRGEKWVKEE